MVYKKYLPLRFRAVKKEMPVNALGQIFAEKGFVIIVSLIQNFLSLYLKQSRSSMIEIVIDEIGQIADKKGLANALFLIKNFLGHYAEQDRLLILEALNEEKNNTNRVQFILNVQSRFEKKKAKRTTEKNRRKKRKKLKKY